MKSAGIVQSIEVASVCGGVFLEHEICDMPSWSIGFDSRTFDLRPLQWIKLGIIDTVPAKKNPPKRIFGHNS